MKRIKGFTLIELLVVIAIIAILAAILFPVFVTARESGKRAKCQSNLKTLVGAVTLYEDEWGMIMPGSLPLQPNETGWDRLWWVYLDKYIRQFNKKPNTNDDVMRGVYLCPSAAKVYTIASNGQRQAVPDVWRRAYGYNYYFLGGKPNKTRSQWDDPEPEVHAPSEVAIPTKTIRWMEVWDHTRSGYPNGIGSAMVYPPFGSFLASLCNPDEVWPPAWHNGLSNVAFFDGHVKAFQFAKPFSEHGTAYTGLMVQGGGIYPPAPWFNLKGPKP